MVLITGAGGMLGRYLCQAFAEENVMTLGLSPESVFRTDLTQESPDFDGKFFETVIHAAGTEEDHQAMEFNLEGTKNLIKALDKNPPDYFVYLSSFQVYSRDAGERVNEETNTWATTTAGKSKALAEQLLKEWSEKKGVVLTIVRPARMFGNGVKGETLTLFNDALNGRYIHIRGNDAKVSLVCALDVAKGINRVYKSGGIYNAADPYPVKFIDMVEAMTANAGAKKRMTHLPASWAEWLWRLGRFIPSIQRNLSPEVVERRMKTLTLDGSLLSEKAGFTYHDTIAVIEHSDPDYPYTANSLKAKKNVREV